MKLKNVLIVVDDMEESICFYQEMFGLQVIMKQEGNAILSDGLVDKLTSSDIFVRFQTELTELDGGRKMVRFYDPSGNLIEVRTPVNHS